MFSSGHASSAAAHSCRDTLAAGKLDPAKPMQGHAQASLTSAGPRAQGTRECRKLGRS
ncbi:hypothetical protein PSAC2689_240005 [Paraburkholderia sacchari]